MSRRKQAKPRAVLKLGIDDDVEQQSSEIQMESKDDDLATMTDDDMQMDDGDDDVLSTEENTNDILLLPSHRAVVKDEGKGNRIDNATVANDIDGPDITVVSVAAAAAAAMAAADLLIVNNAASSEEIKDEPQDYHPSSSGELYKMTDTHHDGVDDDNSIDSFYSDIYSSHTSSSYSPSTSEGALTPNSLLHHPLHHHHLHHLHHRNSHNLQADGSGDVNPLRVATRRQYRGSSLATIANGSCDGPEEDNSNNINNNNGEDDADSHDCGEHTAAAVVSRRRLRRHPRHLTGTVEDNIDDVDEEEDDDDDEVDGNKHQTNGSEGVMGDGGGGRTLTKHPNKLRKIERDAVGSTNNMKSSEKSTSDGIKGSSTDGSYQCQFCDKSFPRLGYLKKHEQSHAEHLPFKCDYCARLFKHKRSRDRHTKLHTGDRRYRCPHCEAAFSRSDHLKIHMKTHDTQKPFQCTVCNRGYNTAAALTSHMQNHKKQAALLGAGGQALNYSPRSTGSGSSNGSFHKRRYLLTTDCSPTNRADYRKHSRLGSFLACIYCTKSDFTSLDLLNAHIQSMHEHAATPKDGPVSTTPVFQLSCEYCTMKFPNIPSMFQHMRTTHIDRLTSPNSYFEHFNRLAASGTFSPRLLTHSNGNLNAPRTTDAETKIKLEQPSPNHDRRSQAGSEKDEEQTCPTDLSQPKKRQSPVVLQEPINGEKSSSAGAFLCNQCNAGLPDFDSFRAHLKSHIAQETTASLVCPHCGLASRHAAEHERHILSHFLITNSEFSCADAGCKKTFVKPDELQKHLFDGHIQTMYKCTICSEVFDTKVAIQVHFACSHSNESKLLRCSACMESFRSEKEFANHVRARHTNSSSAIQCMFCRAVCSSELEMHFHLAAHARQFRCPSCPETFHVEFLLDRHMQTHHSQKDGVATATRTPAIPTTTAEAVATYQGSFAKSAASNNNNNILEYNAFSNGKSLFQQFPANKFYSPLQVDTNAVGNLAKHSALMYGLSQRYFDANKTLMDIYNYNQDQNKNQSPYFISPSNFETAATAARGQLKSQPENKSASSGDRGTGFSCGICERSDFRTESDVHSHRKIVHNLKTGVSLRCAYCSGNFKSRSELEHHMKTGHNSTGKHKCLICDEIFPSPAVLAEHKLQHSKVGQSGKCSHCAMALNDVGTFKSHLSEHNVEGQIPVQCICCRQTLHSDFEVGLHAKFHTKSSGGDPDNLCALCLETLPSTTDSRVCEKCCRKHNLSTKFNLRFGLNGNGHRAYVENRCNLCKMILPHAQRLQEHLVEHTFVGCEERGYSCYICSAVFTIPAGLLSHMLELHGLNARPYDCNLCSEKYFFRAELDNHMIEHEILGGGSNGEPGKTANSTGEKEKSDTTTVMVKKEQSLESKRNPVETKCDQEVDKGSVNTDSSDKVKTEIAEEANETNQQEKILASDEEDEEYIEVENVTEANGKPNDAND